MLYYNQKEGTNPNRKEEKKMMTFADKIKKMNRLSMDKVYFKDNKEVREKKEKEYKEMLKKANNPFA